MQNTSITQQNANNEYFTADFNDESHGYIGDDGFYSGSPYPQTAAGAGDAEQDLAPQKSGALLDGAFADKFINRMTGQTATPAATDSTSGDDNTTSAKLKAMAEKNAEAFKKMTEAGSKQHEAEEKAEAAKKNAEAQKKAMEKMAQKEEAAMKKMEQKQEAQAKAMEQQMKKMEKAEAPPPSPPEKEDENEAPPMVAGSKTGRTVPQVLRKIGDMMFGDAALTAAVIGVAIFAVTTVIAASFALPVLPIVAGAITLSAVSYCGLGGAFRLGTWIYDKVESKKAAAKSGNVKQTSKDKEKEMFEYMDKTMDSKGVDVSRDVNKAKKTTDMAINNHAQNATKSEPQPINEQQISGRDVNKEIQDLPSSVAGYSKPLVDNRKILNATEVKPLAPIEKKDVNLSKEIMKAAREEFLKRVANKGLSSDEIDSKQVDKDANSSTHNSENVNQNHENDISATQSKKIGHEAEHDFNPHKHNNIYNPRVVENGFSDDLAKNIEHQSIRADKWRNHEKSSNYDDDGRSQYAVGV